MTYKSIVAYFPYIYILTDFTLLTKMVYSIGITLTADVSTLTYYMAFIISNMSTMTKSTNMTEMSEFSIISKMTYRTKLINLNYSNPLVIAKLYSQTGIHGK